MSVYRTSELSTIPKQPKNVYRYVVLNSRSCPICNLPVDGWRSEWLGSWKGRQDVYFGKIDHCHPLKRKVIKGWWFWKKLCPVEKVHFHCTCNKCEISWIKFSEKEFEPNYQERIL